MLYSRLRSFFILLTFSFPLILFSQHSIRTHQLISGKKEINVQAIAQDHNRVMWIGTDLGLIRYNGIKYELFQQKDGLANNSVTALMESTDSTLWIGHANGKISLFKGGKISTFGVKDTTDKSPISRIIQDGKKNIWIATYGSGIYLYDGKSILKYNSENGLTDDFVYTICETSPGNIWLGTDRGITLLNNETTNEKERFASITTKNGLPDNIVHVISKDKSGQVWITMRDSGLCKYDIAEKKIIRLSFNGGWKFGPIHTSLIDHSGIIWIGTENSGVITCEANQNTYKRTLFSNHQNALGKEKIACLFEDAEKSIWAGTPTGLAQSYRSRFEFFSAKDGMISDQVRAFMIDSRGTYWLSSSGGLTKFSFDDAGEIKTTNYFTGKDASEIRIVSLFEARDGNIFLGTYGYGLYLLNPETGSYFVFSEKNGLANNNIMSICDDKEGNIWLATLGGGVSKISFENKDDYKSKFQVKNFSEEDGVGSVYVYYAFRDSRNTLWFGTDGGGLTRFDGTNFTSFNTKAGGLKSDIVFSITEDKSGTIWFSCQDGGIYKFNGRTFTNFGTDAGVRDLSPAILSAGAGNDIVVAHNNGIDVLNESASKQARQYNIHESNIDFIPNPNVFWKEKSGNIWIGTEHGLVRFRSALDSLDYLTPKVQLTGLQVMLQLYPLSASSEFDYKRNQFVFEFMGVFLNAPDKVKYKFKLEGYDNDWSLVTENRMASYPNLPNGDYTFMVCASNAEGIWSEPVSYHFIIKPPFWKTWWFYVLCIISVGAGFYGFMKWKVKSLQKQKEVLEEKVETRTREVVEQKKIIEEKNKDITSSIRYAKRIQNALLPAKSYLDEHMGDYFILFKPKDIVSGDFYWVNQKENKLFFASIDCTGHGVPGAFVSLVAHANLQRAMILQMLRVPSEILDNVNESVVDVFSRSGQTEDIKDGMDISLCALDREKMQLEFSGANHPMLLVRNGELREIKGDKQPIGQYVSRKNFTNHSIHLERGDTVYLFSDGYGDQFGGKDGKKFKRSRLKELLLFLSSKSMQDQEKILDTTIEEWKGTLEQIDDILVMGVRI